MAGFSNDVMFADNVNFSGAKSASVLADGQLLIGSTATPNIRVGSLSSSDSSILITNGPGTINLRSNPAVVPDLHVAKWIVNSTPNSGGNQTTIAAAITAASSGDTIFIMPGTYTESFSLKAGVNLTAFGSDSSLDATGKVKIIGTLSFSAAGSVTISGIQLQTNGATNILSVTGSAASIVNLENCYLNCTANTGISFTTANAAAGINIWRCEGNLGTTGIAYHTGSSTGTIAYLYSYFSNTGGSSTISTISAGQTFIFYSVFACPVGTTSTGGISLYDSTISSAAQNAIAVTANGSGVSSSKKNTYESGSASAVTIGASATFTMTHDNINSTNTNAITGAGSLGYWALTFLNTSFKINTTTQTGGTLQGGQTQAPSAGFLGQQISSFAGPSAITSTTIANITSIAITAGIWDVSGFSDLVATAGAFTSINLAIGVNSASFTGCIGGDNLSQSGLTAIIFSPSIPSFRVTLTATTTYYLIVQGVFTGTGTAQGRISATRVG